MTTTRRHRTLIAGFASGDRRQGRTTLRSTVSRSSSGSISQARMTRPTRSKLDGPKPCGPSCDAVGRASPGFSQGEGARSGEYQNSTPTVR